MGELVCFEMHGEWATVTSPTSCGKYWLPGDLHHAGSGVCLEFRVFVGYMLLGGSFPILLGGRGK